MGRAGIKSALLMDYEVLAEVSVPIRATRRDKALNAEQVSDFGKGAASVIVAATACYTDRMPRSRFLCGSI